MTECPTKTGYIFDTESIKKSLGKIAPRVNLTVNRVERHWVWYIVFVVLLIIIIYYLQKLVV